MVEILQDFEPFLVIVKQTFLKLGPFTTLEN